MAAKSKARSSKKVSGQKAKKTKKVASPQKSKLAKAKVSSPKIKESAKPNSRVQSLEGGSGLVPSRDGVLVERVQESERTAGGLIIPVSALEKPIKGIVIKVGKGKINKRGKLRPLDVRPGDEVLFGKYAGTEIKIDGKEFLLVREDEILGVVS